jgi:hypothetical protein
VADLYRCEYLSHFSANANAQFPQKHPGTKPFRTEEFPLFHEMGELIEGMHATRKLAYRGGNPTAPILPAILNSSTDEGPDKGSTMNPAQSQHIQDSTENMTQSQSIQESTQSHIIEESTVMQASYPT